MESTRNLEATMAKEGKKFDLDPRRFRANIFSMSDHVTPDDVVLLLTVCVPPTYKVTGPPPYDEDMWKEIRLKPGGSGLTSDANFQVSCRTVR